MGDLSPAAAEVLWEVQPVLESLAQLASGPENPPLDKGDVLWTDIVTGRCIVTLQSGGTVGAACQGYLPAVHEWVWVRHVAGSPPGFVVEGRVGGVPGTLAMVSTESDVNFGLTPSTIAEVEVTVQENRIIRLTGHVSIVTDTSGSNQVVRLYLMDGIDDAVPTYVSDFDFRHITASQSVALAGVIDIPGVEGGSHLYRMTAEATIGDATAVCAPLGTYPGPATLVVQDLGSAG